ALFVNPTDTTTAGNNTPYVAFSWVGTSAEAASYAEVNLRQGTATAAPTENIDNLAVGSAFSDVASPTPVPEPSSLALAGLGGLASFMAFRRRK
ncbi:MAG TPA: PEP-CTERM sorting domain-containing protein, partial [Pseudomonadales bacterium]|nr:PEP-CTERM sorting domain-containing protein [Pseudomonadales bacterium]